MKKILNKVIILTIILMLILVNSPIFILESKANQVKTDVFETFGDYLGKNFWVQEGNSWIKKEIEYEQLNKDEVTNIWIRSVTGGFNENEEFIEMPLAINNFNELYEFKNLKELIIENLETIEKIDFSKLVNLEEVTIRGGKINGKIDFNSNKNLKSIYINISSDLSNTVINVDELGKNTNVHFQLSVTSTSDFAITKLVPNIDMYTTIIGNKVDCLFAWGMGGSGARVKCDTVGNYLKHFYPDTPIDEIVELDFDRDSVMIKDLSSLSELKNLRTFVISDHYEAYPKIDLTQLKKLKEFKYIYYDYGDGPVFGKDIISDDYSYIKKQKNEHTYIDEEGETHTWYDTYYYFNKYMTNEDLVIEKLSDINKINGFSLTENKLNIKEVLEANYFAEDLEVKVFNAKDEEVTDTSKTLGTGSKIKLYENGEEVKEYIVVIYGDTTGDGVLTAVDALTLIKAINKKIELTGEEYLEAGRIISGENPSAVDALAIIKHLNKKYEINQK